jgi:hypothetical protein
MFIWTKRLEELCVLINGQTVIYEDLTGRFALQGTGMALRINRSLQYLNDLCACFSIKMLIL